MRVAVCWMLEANFVEVLRTANFLIQIQINKNFVLENVIKIEKAWISVPITCYRKTILWVIFVTFLGAGYVKVSHSTITVYLLWSFDSKNRSKQTKRDFCLSLKLVTTSLKTPFGYFSCDSTFFCLKVCCHWIRK